MTDLQILGLPPEATAEQIKERYRALALKHHPDRGGTAEGFAIVTSAYDRAMAAAAAPRGCPECHGSKKKSVAHGFSVAFIDCPTCGGTGEVGP